MKWLEYKDFFKALESREIIKNVIEQEYNNPLGELIEKEELINILPEIMTDNVW